MPHHIFLVGKRKISLNIKIRGEFLEERDTTLITKESVERDIRDRNIKSSPGDYKK